MCHHALTFESNFTRLTPKVFSKPCSAMMTRNAMNVVSAVTGTSKTRFISAIQVMAAP